MRAAVLAGRKKDPERLWGSKGGKRPCGSGQWRGPGESGC